MSLERVRAQLGKFGLAKPNDEMAVTVQSLSPYYLFSDSIGETFLIARADDVEQRLNAISYNMGKLTYEQFWSGVWLGRVPHYRGFDELWESLAAVHRQRIGSQGIRKALYRSGKEVEQRDLAL